MAAQASFAVDAGNGYTATVEGHGSKLELEVEGHEGTTVYSVRGRVSTRRLVGRFGKLGRVALRFKPGPLSGRTQPPRGCKGKDVVSRRGVFVGSFRFRGEGGYLGVRRSRLVGTTKSSPSWRCKRPRRGGEGGGGTDGLEELIPLKSPLLGAFVPGSQITFAALEEGLGLTTFVVGARERRGAMRIARFAFTFGEAGTFTVSSRLRRATVKPPEPFAGRARFSRRGEGFNAWTGNLTVAFPGAPALPLTGPSFIANLGRPKTLGEFASILGQPGLTGPAEFLLPEVD